MARADLKLLAKEGDGGFDINYVYMGKAQDEHGHSAHLRVHVPQHWTGQVAEIVESKDTPYRTASDFYRDAIFSRLSWYGSAENRPTLELMEDVAMMRLTAKSDAIKQRDENSRQMLKSTVEALRLLVANREFPDAREFIRYGREQADHLSEPWRSQLLTELNSFERQLQ